MKIKQLYINYKKITEENTDDKSYINSLYCKDLLFALLHSSLIIFIIVFGTKINYSKTDGLYLTKILNSNKDILIFCIVTLPLFFVLTYLKICRYLKECEEKVTNELRLKNNK